MAAWTPGRCVASAIPTAAFPRCTAIRTPGRALRASRTCTARPDRASGATSRFMNAWSAVAPTIARQGRYAGPPGVVSSLAQRAPRARAKHPPATCGDSACAVRWTRNVAPPRPPSARPRPVSASRARRMHIAQLLSCLAAISLATSVCAASPRRTATGRRRTAIPSPAIASTIWAGRRTTTREATPRPTLAPLIDDRICLNRTGDGTPYETASSRPEHVLVVVFAVADLENRHALWRDPTSPPVAPPDQVTTRQCKGRA